MAFFTTSRLRPETRNGEVEGRLRAHTLVGGTYVDRLTLAIYREAWAPVWEVVSRGHPVHNGAEWSESWWNRSAAERLDLLVAALDRWGFGDEVLTRLALEKPLGNDLIVRARLILCLEHRTGTSVPPECREEMETLGDALAFGIGADAYQEFVESLDQD